MLKNDTGYSPFMGDGKTLSIGLNPLGIRTASEQLFTTLLPGLNVVTLRIRYYSFYCWLLKRFYLQRTQANLFDLRKHIRMSELLMALIHAKSQNSGGVPGITRAYEIIGKEEDSIKFGEDAMPEGKPSGGYWKGSLGALGTYYIASLQELGIVRPLRDNPNLYNITSKNDNYISGEELADSFAETIGDDMCKMFEECVKNGEVSRNQLSEMEPYFQTHNLPDNNETRLLLKLLLQNDNPTSQHRSDFRKNTIRLLLDFFNEKNMTEFSELKFARYVYDKYSKGNEKSNAAVGWYAYYLNDSRQYEALNIFDVVLNRLLESVKPGKWEHIDELATELADDVCNSLGVKDKTLIDVLNNWNTIQEPLDKLSHAFYNILNDYQCNNNYQNCKMIIRDFFRSVNNDAMDAFDVMGKYLKEPLQSYVKSYIINDIIYMHYSESMRKFSQNGVPTQKLTIENGYVRGLSSYEATHSSPRVDTLRNFITDLGLIDGFTLTKKGIELLCNLDNDRT